MLNGCPTGQAKITKGYNLPVKYVIHTVGPVWHGGKNNEDDLLGSCYKNSLLVAKQNKIKSIAFPSISTGVYGFPFERSCSIALKEIYSFISLGESITDIFLICFSKNDFEKYNSIHQQYIKDNKL